MSAKMRAGLLAGGFGVAFEVGVFLLSTLGVPASRLLALLLAAFFLLLYLVIFFGPPILAGIMAAAWLDLEDYGRQFSVGAFAGVVVALMIGACSLILNFIQSVIQLSDPPAAQLNAVIQEIPLVDKIPGITFVIILYALGFLIFLGIMMLISGITAKIVGAGKGLGTIQRMLEEQEAEMNKPLPPPIDPSLAPYQRPEYSPFASEHEVMLSPWQRRRLEREGKLPDEEPGSQGEGY